MAESPRNFPRTPLQGTLAAPRVPLVPFGLGLGLFLVITYVLCVGFDLLLPAQAMHSNWEHLLPGFTWLSWMSFVIGLVESFAYAWYVALIFCPLFNFFAARSNLGIEHDRRRTNAGDDQENRRLSQ